MPRRRSSKRRLWVLMVYLDGDTVPVGVFSNLKMAQRLEKQVNEIRTRYGGEEALYDYNAFVEQLEHVDINPPLVVKEWEPGAFSITRKHK